MFTFQKEFHLYVRFKNLPLTMDRCFLYDIKKDDNTICKLYTGKYESFMEYNNQKYRIEKKMKIFKKDRYLIFNYLNNDSIGYYEFADNQWFGKTACTMYLNGRKPFHFIQNDAHKNIFKKSTWNSYRFDMTDSVDDAHYLGKFTGSKTKGEIYTTNETDLLPVFLGLFMAEEKFRLIMEKSYY
ncbi:MAG: hypothetical protein QM731_26375 [Chitinophagaceae bacterium]